MDEAGSAAAQLSLRFLGVGSAQASALGSSSAVLERDGAPVLLVDAGIGVLDRYFDVYGALPLAAFITHTHLDHIGDLEVLREAQRAYERVGRPDPIALCDRLGRRSWQLGAGVGRSWCCRRDSGLAIGWRQRADLVELDLGGRGQQIGRASCRERVSSPV